MSDNQSDAVVGGGQETTNHRDAATMEARATAERDGEPGPAGDGGDEVDFDVPDYEADPSVDQERSYPVPPLPPVKLPTTLRTGDRRDEHIAIAKDQASMTRTAGRPRLAELYDFLAAAMSDPAIYKYSPDQQGNGFEGTNYFEEHPTAGDRPAKIAKWLFSPEAASLRRNGFLGVLPEPETLSDAAALLARAAAESGPFSFVPAGAAPGSAPRTRFIFVAKNGEVCAKPLAVVCWRSIDKDGNEFRWMHSDGASPPIGELSVTSDFCRLEIFLLRSRTEFRRYKDDESQRDSFVVFDGAKWQFTDHTLHKYNLTSLIAVLDSTSGNPALDSCIANFRARVDHAGSKLKVVSGLHTRFSADPRPHITVDLSDDMSMYHLHLWPCNRAVRNANTRPVRIGNQQFVLVSIKGKEGVTADGKAAYTNVRPL